MLITKKASECTKILANAGSMESQIMRPYDCKR